MTLRRTVAHPVTAVGTALHAGIPVTMTLSPAASGSGIVFRRTDLGTDIAARYDLVSETRLGTVIGQGSAKIGVVAIKVLKPVTVESGEARASLLPDNALSFSYELSFPVIGEQYYAFAFSRAGFKAEIAPARTFGFLAELEALNKMDLAKGASLANTLALDYSGVVNRERQRFADEFVRHKILDAIGDMALAGAPLIARFEGRKSGHTTNNALLRALFADSRNYELREL